MVQLLVYSWYYDVNIKNKINILSLRVYLSSKSKICYVSINSKYEAKSSFLIGGKYEMYLLIKTVYSILYET